MGIFHIFERHSNSGGVFGAVLRAIIRFFQFVLAITVAGLYGIDLHAANQAHAYIDGKWVYAEVVAGITAATCIVYGIPFFKSYWAFGWDWILFVMWTALFGTFGKIYIPDQPTPKQSGQIRMKHAVWVDLTCVFLWMISAVYSTVIFFRFRKERATPSSKV